MPVKEATVRELADRQAEQRGVVIEAAVEHAVDHLDFARSILGRVHRRVLRGELEPDLRDGLRAAELLARYDPGPQVDESTYVEAFAIFHEAAASIMTPEQTAEMSQKLSQHPRLRELAQQWEGASGR